MTIQINGTSGISGVDGSAGTPALQGSDSNTGISFGTDTVNINTGGTTRATVDSSGRVLVGTSSTSQSLTAAFQGVSGSSTAGAVLALSRGLPAPSIDAQGYLLGRITFTDNSQTPYAQIEGISDAAAGTNDYPGRIVLSTTADGASSPTERMRIRSDGYVLFNTTSEVSGGGVGAQIGFSGQNYWRSRSSGTSSYGHLAFYNDNGQVGSISTSGSSTVYGTSSDYRLKENVTVVTDGITRLQQLKPARFNFIADPDTTVDGFIAHEVQAVVPEAIAGEKDAVDADGNPVYQGIDQSKLVPLLTAALQEAIAKIETLETRLTALEGGAAQ